MEDFSADTLISLYTQLRDPTGQTVNEVTDQLNEILQIPQSIICFFDVITQADDPIFRSYAALNVRDYIIFHKNDISEDIIQNIRKLIIECLSKEQNSTARLQIINVISVLINYFPDEWPELNSFVYTDDYLSYLSSIIQILIFIFSKFNDEELSNQMEYFMQLVLSGFESDDFNCNYYAVYFFYLILIKINDITQFEVFQEPLYQLLETTIKKQDAQILAQFLEPISVGMYNNIIFLPLDKVFTLILPILSSDIEIDIKSPLNSLLSLYLQFDTSQITTEMLEQIFSLEVNLAIELYDLSIDDPTLSWIYDCISVFEGIYMRISEETVVQMSFGQFQEIIEQKEPKYILAATSALIPAISMIPENFDSLIDTIFSQLLNFLGNSDTYVQRFVSESLSNIAPDFSDFITNNINEIIEAILYFIQEGVAQGTNFLSYILDSIAFSDTIFESLLPTALEWIKSPDPMTKQDAAMIVCSLITKSEKLVPHFADKIATTSMSLLKDSLEAYYPVYNIFGSLCDHVPDKMNSYLPDFIPILMEGIHSTDLSVKDQAIQTIYDLRKVLFSSPDFLEFIEQICNVLLEIANSELDETVDDQVLSISGAAVFQASCLVFGPNSKLLPDILSAVVHIARLPSMNCLHEAVKSFNALTNLIMNSPLNNEKVTNPTEEMIGILIEKLAESSRYEFVILRDIINAIAGFIRLCGVDKLKGKELELIEILSSVLTQTMNPYTGAISCPDDILNPISELFVGLAFSTNEGITKDILDALLPILTSFLDHKSYQYQVFSINTFSCLISRNMTMYLMPDEMKQELIQNMLKRITEAIPKVSAAAANFIYKICKNEESQCLLEECLLPTLTVLMERLESITNLTTDNISLRESIILAVASIGNYMFEGKEDFPLAETMPTILKALPIVKQIQFNTEVYKFLISKSMLVDESLKPEYIRIYTWVFSQPKTLLQQMRIDMFSLKKMGNILEAFLDEFPPEEQKEMIETFLDNDEYRLACFSEGFDAIKKFQFPELLVQ